MATSMVWMALSALVGAGAALITTLTMQSTEKASPQAVRKPAEATSKDPQSSKPIIIQASPGRLDALEQEVMRLRNERNEAATSNSPVEIADPEQERRRVEARFSELEHQLLADPVDPSWSGGATESLRSGLSTLAKARGFDVVAVECRTDMCRATLRWDNYEAAVRTGMQLPERAIPGLNCVNSIWLREPNNLNEPYSASLYLDCSEQRAGNVDIMPVATTTGEMP